MCLMYILCWGGFGGSADDDEVQQGGGREGGINGQHNVPKKGIGKQRNTKVNTNNV